MFTKKELQFILIGMKADLDRELNARRGDEMMTEDGIRTLQDLISRIEEAIKKS